MFGRNKNKSSKWTCERVALGDCCADGPDKQGCCQAGSACHPVKKGDRWYCNRLEEYGGPCSKGPTESGQCTVAVEKCKPIRSANYKYAMTTRIIMLLSIGLIAVVLGARYWSKNFEPGPLSSAHSANMNCEDCHSNYKFSPLHNLHMLLTGKVASKNSKACLQCHDLGKHPFATHNIPQMVLREHQQQAEKKIPSGSHLLRAISHAVLGANIEQRQLNCTVCHEEHHGNVPMLLKHDDDLCQSCHMHAFTNFSDHPEFSYYPHEIRTNIIFDHLSHINKHFKDEKYQQYAPKECSACHHLNSGGQMMLLHSYEQTCAACHDNEIIGQSRAGDKGVAIITIPGIDFETLKEHKIDIGPWPEDAEGELNQFMVVMLAENPGFIAVYEQVKNLDLMDLTDANEQQMQAVAQLAAQIKTFLNELAVNGTEKLYQNIDRVSSLDLRFREYAPTIMSYDMLKELMNSAFKRDYKIDEQVSKVSAQDWLSHGGWYREGFSIYYLPRKHNDEFMYSWIKLSGHLKPEIKALLHHELFNTLVDTKAPGMCAKCHSVVKADDGRMVMQWKMRELEPFRQHFSKFYHKPHLSVIDENVCNTCHVFNEQADYLESFKQFDPTKFESSFKPISKTVCAQCHKDSQGNASCLTCHDYHVGQVKDKTKTNIIARVSD